MKSWNKVTAALLSFALLVVSMGCPCPVPVARGLEPEQVGPLAPVTELHWVEGSSATAAWIGSADANYYAVTVRVYEPDGVTPIGTEETGTTAAELDVQQEIHNAVGEAEYDTVKVTVTVYAQKKQDDELVAQSDGVTTDLWEYQLAAVLQLAAPTDLVLTDDCQMTCTISTPLANYLNADFGYKMVYNDKEITGYLGGWFGGIPANGNWTNDFSNDIKNAYFSNGFAGETVQVSVRIKISTFTAGYSESEWSEFSNEIDYYCEETAQQLAAPTDLVLADDCQMTCTISTPLVNYLNADFGYKMVYNDKEITGYLGGWFGGIPANGNWTNDFSNDIKNAYFSNGFAGETVQVSVRIKISTFTAGYFESEWSEFSNEIDYSFRIPVESLTLAPAAPIVCKGHSYYLGKTVDPVDAYYETIDWASEDGSIVTVDENGMITGVQVGTANVNAAIGEIAASVPVTVYELSSNVEDPEDKEEIIDAAGDIIDDIANNEDPDLSNTDIDGTDLEEIKDDIHDGMENGADFWVNFKDLGRGLGHYQAYWNDPAFWTWYESVYGTGNGWHLGWGVSLEYEIGYTLDGTDHHIGNIVEFESEFEFSFLIPDEAEMDHPGNGKKRIYNLVRVHNGEYEIIPVEVDKNGKVKAKSNKYSDFILLYEDVEETAFEQLVEKETHSATVGDVITLNYYLALQEGVTDPVMTLWLEENEKTEVAGELQTDGRYKFRYGVAAPQMTRAVHSTITALKDGTQITTEPEIYSVREYCEAIIRSEKTKQTMKDLAAQMLNYGAYAQIYFGCDTDDLANKNLAALGYSTELDTDAIDPDAAESFGNFAGEIKARFTTNSLIFQSDMRLKYYIELDDGVQNAYMAYRLKGSGDAYGYIPLTPTGNRYSATITGIKAPLLPEKYETFICVKEGDAYTQISQTKYYSPECYATAIYQRGSNPDMRNAAVAMMMYCRAARIHFELD